MSFTFQIHCPSGLLYHGSSADFLMCVHRAGLARTRCEALAPNSRLRGLILSPGGDTVSAKDIGSAIIALQNATVMALLLKRNECPISQISECVRGVGFSQAGVVAPPDSPDLGTGPVFDPVLPKAKS